MSEADIYTADFEIFGEVQGVFFRKHTLDQARSLNLKGFVRNSEDGTVKGRMQGPTSKIEEMKRWLIEVGSPSSKIDQAVFTEESKIEKYSEGEFKIVE